MRGWRTALADIPRQDSLRVPKNSCKNGSRSLQELLDNSDYRGKNDAGTTYACKNALQEMRHLILAKLSRQRIFDSKYVYGTYWNFGPESTHIFGGRCGDAK